MLGTELPLNRLEVVPPAASGSTPVYVSARRTAAEFGWDDLPGIHDDTARRWEHQREIGRLLRFAAVWRNMMQPELRPRGLMDPKPAWFKRNDLGKIKFDVGETKQGLEKLDDVVSRVLIWAGSIQMFAPSGAAGFKLWDVSPIVAFSPQRNPDDPNDEQVRLKDRLIGDSGADAYRRLIVERDQGKTPPPDQSALFQEINNQAPLGNHKGLGKIVAAVHRAARLPATAEQAADA